MKKLACLWILLLVAGACTVQQNVGEESTPGEVQVVAFEGVNVVPMDEERILSDQTVVVRGDRIAEIGPVDEVTVPEEALRIEGNGAYLMPGLAEMHGHIPPPSDPEAYVESVLFLYVANGITTVRGMQGHEGQLDLRDQAARGEIVSPTLYLAGPGFSGGSIDSPEQAAERVRTQEQEGWDLLKVLPGLTREEYDAMAEAANEAGIRFAGHVPSDVGLMHAIEMGQETFDHLDGYIEYLNGDEGPVDEAQLEEVVQLTREADAWVIPTMALWETLNGTIPLETLLDYEELRYMPPDLVADWTESYENRISNPNFDLTARRQLIDNRMRLLQALHEGGVKILMGTDAPQQFSVPGFSLHRELERMVDAGMTPYEIWRTGTYNVGQYFAEQDDFGTVAPGQRADLILLDANPLEDVAHLQQRLGVMVRGRWLSEQDIQSRLDAIAASYDQAETP